jgi:hypothetical protein
VQAGGGGRGAAAHATRWRAPTAVKAAAIARGRGAAVAGVAVSVAVPAQHRANACERRVSSGLAKAWCSTLIGLCDSCKALQSSAPPSQHVFDVQAAVTCAGTASGGGRGWATGGAGSRGHGSETGCSSSSACDGATALSLECTTMHDTCPTALRSLAGHAAHRYPDP